MRTTNLGMPNVYGTLIKKAVEKYKKGLGSQEEVYIALGRVAEHNANIQRGLDLSPVFDIDIVDRTLKTSVMFGVVPYRLGEPEEVANSLDNYLTMLWGKEGVSSVAMLKWFGTNYHFAQPEFERAPKLAKDFVSYLIEPGTKPALIGPWTIIKLGANRTNFNDENLFGILSAQYARLINSFPNGTIVQIEEPSFLTHGLPNFYGEFLKLLRDRTVHLHTYYSHVIDFAQNLFDLDVSGIGLDFVDGKENLILLKDFPKNVDLIAGIISGKSGQPADYATKKTLDEILKHVSEDKLWISPSCPLLHLRLAASGIGLPEAEKRSYAIEKLLEINALGNGTFQAPSLIISKRYELPTERYSRARNPEFVLDEPFLPSHIGSSPQTQELRKVRAAYNSGEISEESYRNYIFHISKETIGIHRKIGIKKIPFPEYERDDMVAFFARKWKGYSTPKGNVQSLGTLHVKPPVILGDISVEEPASLEWMIKGKEFNPDIKATLTGPVTMVLWSERRYDIPLYAQFYQAAGAVREEIRHLLKIGIENIQVDEPALGEGIPLIKPKIDKYIYHATNSFRLATKDVSEGTTLWSHLCFTEFNEQLLRAINGLEVDIITIENARSGGKNAKYLIEHGYQGVIGVGAFDVHSSRIRPAEEIVRDFIGLRKLGLPRDKIAVVPDCGCKATPSTPAMTAEQIVNAQLTEMVKGSDILKSMI